MLHIIPHIKPAKQVDCCEEITITYCHFRIHLLDLFRMDRNIALFDKKLQS